MDRRDFMKMSVAGLCGGGLVPANLLAGQPSFSLTAGLASFPLAGAEYPAANLWLFNGMSPGPELRLRQGQQLELAVTNRLDEPTAIHWHGIRNVNAMDGVPYLTQPPIEPGETFHYSVPLDKAGTYWYHAHNRSWEQVARGLYGPLIIEGEEDPLVDHDLVMMLDDWRLDDAGQLHEASFGSLHDFSHAGRLGNWLTVNGRSDAEMAVRPGARVRLRLISATNARILKLDFAGLEVLLIAEDGRACLHQPVSGVRLGPGQRADLLFTMDSPLFELREVSGGDAYPAGRLVADPDLGGAGRQKPPLVQPSLPAMPDPADARVVPLHMQGGAMGNLAAASYQGEMLPLRELAQQHSKLWAFNGIVGDYAETLVEAQLGEVIMLDIFNDTAWPHAMHLHGHHFWVLADDPAVSLPSGMRDTWLIEPGKRASLVFVADNPGKWLFHCHMLEHAASGMVSVIEVS